MSSPAVEHPHIITTTPSRLFVAWQHPVTRAFSPVGVLDRVVDGGFEFRYLPHAASVEGFAPFLNFPVYDEVYRSSELFPFFTNRVISSRRGDFHSMVEAIGLDGTPEPYEILVRNGGIRATDTIEIYPEPQIDRRTGTITTIFLTRGIRHQGEAALQRLALLTPGDRLDLVAEPTNPSHSQAIQIQSAGIVLGYLPNYLHPILSEIYASHEVVTVTVVQANPSTLAPQMRLLCHLQGQWISSLNPFNELVPPYIE